MNKKVLKPAGFKAFFHEGENQDLSFIQKKTPPGRAVLSK